MNIRYRLFRRGKAKVFYIHDQATGKQQSLKTSDRRVAERLLQARTESELAPTLIRQIGAAYLRAADPEAERRTWSDVMAYHAQRENGCALSSKIRTHYIVQSKRLDPIRHKRLLQTSAADLLNIANSAGVSLLDYLKRFHKLALDLGWIPGPIVPAGSWPVIRYRKKRGISEEEHQRVLAVVRRADFRLFLELLWEIGASQSDAAQISAENIFWDTRTLTYQRAKLARGNAGVARIKIGPKLEALLRRLPTKGFLFPKLAPMHESVRGQLFRRAREEAGVKDVTLHCYRYAWAERAARAGYPERYAMSHLGHGSTAVHRAYSRSAEVICPALEEFVR